MKKLVFIFAPLLFLLSGCDRSPPHYDAGVAAVFSHAKIMKKTKPWELQGFGGSFYGNDIKNLIAEFAVYSDEEFTYADARDLIVVGVEKFLSEINSNQSLKKYLNHYPFTFEDIEYSVVFNTTAHEQVSYISLVRGFLVYRIFDQALIESTLLFEEPYANALAEVRSRDNKDVAEGEQASIK